MAALTTFPTIVNDAFSMAGPTMTAIGAGSLDIVPGMVCDIDATGTVFGTVQATLAVSGDVPLGVALTHSDVSASEKFTLALAGCICYVAEGVEGTIDQGDWVMTSSNAIGGCVIPALVSATGVAEGAIQTNVIGLCLEDIAANGTGRILVMPNTITRPNST